MFAALAVVLSMKSVKASREVPARVLAIDALPAVLVSWNCVKAKSWFVIVALAAVLVLEKNVAPKFVLFSIEFAAVLELVKLNVPLETVVKVGWLEALLVTPAPVNVKPLVPVRDD